MIAHNVMLFKVFFSTLGTFFYPRLAQALAFVILRDRDSYCFCWELTQLPNILCFMDCRRMSIIDVTVALQRLR